PAPRAPRPSRRARAGRPRCPATATRAPVPRSGQSSARIVPGFRHPAARPTRCRRPGRAPGLSRPRAPARSTAPPPPTPSTPPPPARGLLPVQVARIVSGRELTESPDVRSPSPRPRVGPASARVLRRDLGHARRERQRIDDDLARERGFAVLAEETEREARQQ